MSGSGVEVEIRVRARVSVWVQVWGEGTHARRGRMSSNWMKGGGLIELIDLHAIQLFIRTFSHSLYQQDKAISIDI